MISKDVIGEERERFISLLSKFPKLLINVYSQIKREGGIKHHIKLKESVPIAQMLQQSEIQQKSFSFIICVSPIVVVLKKSDINFQPSYDSNKQDQL